MGDSDGVLESRLDDPVQRRMDVYRVGDLVRCHTVAHRDHRLVYHDGRLIAYHVTAEYLAVRRSEAVRYCSFPFKTSGVERVGSCVGGKAAGRAFLLNLFNTSIHFYINGVYNQLSQTYPGSEHTPTPTRCVLYPTPQGVSPDARYPVSRPVREPPVVTWTGRR